MKKQYTQPVCYICDIEVQTIIATSIPGGGEIPIGGGGLPDAARYRNTLWNDYEQEEQ